MMQNNISTNNQMDENLVTIEDILKREHERELERERVALSKKYAIFDRILEKAKRYNFDIPQQVMDEIGQKVTDVKGGVTVITRQVENPIVVECGDRILEYSLDKTCDGDRTVRPYILSLWFINPEDDKTAKEKRLEKALMAKGVPIAIDIVKKVGIERDFAVQVYKYVRDFALAVSALTQITDSDFVGQKVKNCAFSPNMPVGIVKDNVVYVYAPTSNIAKAMWEFPSSR